MSLKELFICAGLTIASGVFVSSHAFAQQKKPKPTPAPTKATEPEKPQLVTIPLELRGVKIGDPKGQIERDFGVSCTTTGCGVTYFAGVTLNNPIPVDKQNFAGWTVMSYLFTISDEKLASMTITYYTAGFSAVYQGLKGKFGMPTHMRELAVQNSYGATFQNWIFTWVGEKDEITIERYYGDLETGSTTLVSRAYLKEQELKRSAPRKDL